jgi:hypothetical protein
MPEIYPLGSDSQFWKLDHIKEPYIDKSLDFTSTMIKTGSNSYYFTFNIGLNGPRRKK